jgi:hypothetical protein
LIKIAQDTTAGGAAFNNVAHMEGRAALRRSPARNVSDGSKGDMNRSNRDVRFTPKSGHCQRFYEYTPLDVSRDPNTNMTTGLAVGTAASESFFLKLLRKLAFAADELAGVLGPRLPRLP